MEKIILSSYQKIRLNWWERGIVNNDYLHGLIKTFANQIPYNLLKNGTDSQIIEYIINNSIVNVDVHRSINFNAMLERDFNQNIAGNRKKHGFDKEYKRVVGIIPDFPKIQYLTKTNNNIEAKIELVLKNSINILVWKSGTECKRFEVQKSGFKGIKNFLIENENIF